MADLPDEIEDLLKTLQDKDALKAWGERVRAERAKWTPEQKAEHARDLGEYILNPDHTVTPATDSDEWAMRLETADRRVRLTRVGPYVVSTVFLGLDHNHMRRGPPILFETMVYVELEHDITFPPIPEMGFEGHTFHSNQDFEDTQERCSTWEEALMQHQGVVDEIRRANYRDEVEELTEKDKAEHDEAVKERQAKLDAQKGR